MENYYICEVEENINDSFLSRVHSYSQTTEEYELLCRLFSCVCSQSIEAEKFGIGLA